MAVDLKTLTPDTSLPTDGFLFGADSQSAASPSVYSTQTVATTLLGSTALTGATVTTDKPVLDLSQTWNASGVTFTGLKFNATDTASAAGSLLLNIGTGGGTYSSKFRVRKDGKTYPGGVLYIGLASDTSQLYFHDDATNRSIFSVQSYLQIGISSGASLGWSSGVNATGTLDTFLTRAAAATLQLGAADTTGTTAPTPQFLRIQSWSSSTNANQAGADFTIQGSRGTGTGAGGSIIFQVAPAGSSGTAQNAYATALTITGDRRLVLANFGSSVNPVIVGYDSGGIQSGFYFPNSGLDLAFTRANSVIWGVSFLRCSVIAGARFSWGSSTNPLGTEDLILERDAANTLALRNGANAQRFNSYRSYTDASNYQRLSLHWNTSTALVMNEGAGTGADGSVAFNDAALATDATRGFIMVPSCAGSPTGTPADIPTGQIPLVWDSTNLKLYVYTGGAWKASAAFT